MSAPHTCAAASALIDAEHDYLRTILRHMDQICPTPDTVDCEQCENLKVAECFSGFRGSFGKFYYAFSFHLKHQDVLLRALLRDTSDDGAALHCRQHLDEHGDLTADIEAMFQHVQKRTQVSEVHLVPATMAAWLERHIDAMDVPLAEHLSAMPADVMPAVRGRGLHEPGQAAAGD